MGGPSGVLDLTSPSPTPPVAMPTAAPHILAMPRLNIPQVKMHMHYKHKRDASEEGEEEGESEKESNTSSPPPTCGRWYTLHGDERESAQNTKQGSSASGKTLKHLTLTH